DRDGADGCQRARPDEPRPRGVRDNGEHRAGGKLVSDGHDVTPGSSSRTETTMPEASVAATTTRMVSPARLAPVRAWVDWEEPAGTVTADPSTVTLTGWVPGAPTDTDTRATVQV